MKSPLRFRQSCLSALLSFAVSLFILGAGTLACSAGTALTAPSSRTVTLDEIANWKDDTLDPVLDPIVFEDAIIRSELRPVMGYQHMSGDFVTRGGDLQVYGLQLRWAVTDRLGLIISKGGYNVVNPGVGPRLVGWGDLQFGVKYALIDSPENQFILTGGVLFEVPTGEDAVFQGRGNGIWNFFVASEKGFGKFHLLGNVGFMVPNDSDANSAEVHYHLQADYRCCKWFHPYVAANGYTVINEGKSFPFTTEGYDLVNFGSSAAGGSTQFTLGGGFRAHLTKRIDFGFGYEKAVVKPLGLLDDRYTIDFVIHF